MTNEQASYNLIMIRLAFIDNVTKEQEEVIDCTFNTALKALEQEPNNGHWIREEKEFIVPSRIRPIKETVLICSNCNRRYVGINEDFKYCPNCGAKMEESEVSQ